MSMILPLIWLGTSNIRPRESVTCLKEECGGSRVKMIIKITNYHDLGGIKM